jgi:hypothetical protein
MMRKKSNRIDAAGKKTKKIDLVRINRARVLFFLNAALWLGYVIYIYYDMAVVNNNRSSADMTTIYVFVNAIAMLASGIQFGKSQKWTYYFALFVVSANTLLAVLNILDLFFLGVFILDLFILFIIIPMYKIYQLKP